MRAIRTRQLFSQADPAVNGVGVYGSSRAGEFIQDAIAGTDSVDVVTIGDSNAGNPATYGYQVGLERTLAFTYGIPPYATPLCPGAVTSGSNTRSDGMVMAGNTYSWPADGAAGVTGTVRTLVGAYVAALPYAEELQDNLGYDPLVLPKFISFDWQGAYVDSGVTYTSAANQNYIDMKTTSLMNIGTGSGLTSCQYRIVYGKFSGGSGQFKPVVWTSAGSTLAANYVPTNGGTPEDCYATTTLNFTTKTPVVGNRGGWDGMSQGGPTTGPFACLWHSIIRRSFKGMAVNNLMYDGGKSTTQLADRVEGMEKLLDAYLKELRERQIEAGGTGRVVIWLNSGINSDTAATWETGATRIRNRIAQRWVATGGSLSNLAFVFSVTHPVITVAGNDWATRRASVSAAANAWATTNASDGYNVAVVDINVPYPTYKLNNGSTPAGTLYDAGGQSHLNASTTTQNNGYDAVAGSIIAALLSSL